MQLKNIFGWSAVLLAFAAGSVYGSGTKTFKQYEEYQQMKGEMASRKVYLRNTASAVARQLGDPSLTDTIKELFSDWADSSEPIQAYMDNALCHARQEFNSFNSRRSDAIIGFYSRFLKENPGSCPLPSVVAKQIENNFNARAERAKASTVREVFRYLIMSESAKIMFHDEWEAPKSNASDTSRQLNFIPEISGEFLEGLGYGGQYVTLNEFSVDDLLKLLEGPYGNFMCGAIMVDSGDYPEIETVEQLPYDLREAFNEVMAMA
jgi:hypothetical protein